LKSTISGETQEFWRKQEVHQSGRMFWKTGT
jgi:hypothetical protein